MYGDLRTQLQAELDEIRAAGLYKGERVIDTPQAAHVGVGCEAPVLNLCANNYLGLANHPEVIAAAREALDEWGYGLASVRFICGTQKIHKQLEDKLTDRRRMNPADVGQRRRALSQADIEKPVDASRHHLHPLQPRHSPGKVPWQPEPVDHIGLGKDGIELAICGIAAGLVSLDQRRCFPNLHSGTDGSYLIEALLIDRCRYQHVDRFC